LWPASLSMRAQLSMTRLVPPPWTAPDLTIASLNDVN
jgi:hypothetical protein